MRFIAAKKYNAKGTLPKRYLGFKKSWQHLSLHTLSIRDTEDSFAFHPRISSRACDIGEARKSAVNFHQSPLFLFKPQFIETFEDMCRLILTYHPKLLSTDWNNAAILLFLFVASHVLGFICVLYFRWLLIGNYHIFTCTKHHLNRLSIFFFMMPKIIT